MKLIVVVILWVVAVAVALVLVPLLLCAAWNTLAVPLHWPRATYWMAFSAWALLGFVAGLFRSSRRSHK